MTVVDEEYFVDAFASKLSGIIEGLTDADTETKVKSERELIQFWEGWMNHVSEIVTKNKDDKPSDNLKRVMPIVIMVSELMIASNLMTPERKAMFELIFNSNKTKH